MNTAHAASEPGSSATFEGSILVLFQAIVEKLRTGGDLNFTIAGAPVTLTQDNSTRRNLKIMFKVGSAQVGYAQLLSERYTQEQLERLGVKGQHYVYIARSAAPDTTIPRACAQLEHWKLQANAKPSDLLRKIIFEFTQLCKKYPLPRPVVQAAAEPASDLRGRELLEAWAEKLTESCQAHDGLVVARHGKFAVHLKNKRPRVGQTYIELHLYTTYGGRVVDTRWHGDTFPLPEVTLILVESGNTQKMVMKTNTAAFFAESNNDEITASVPAPNPNQLMKTWTSILQKHVHELFADVDTSSITLMPESAEAAAEPQLPPGSEVDVFDKLFAALSKKPSKEIELPNITYTHERVHGSRTGDIFTYSMRLQADELHNFILVHMKLLSSSVELSDVSRKAVADLTAVIRRLHGGSGLVMELPRPDGSESVVPVRMQSATLSAVAGSIASSTLKILDRHIWRYVKSSWAAASAEPQAILDSDTDIVGLIARRFGTATYHMDLRNILDNDVVWETPVKARYGNCALHVVKIGLSDDCVFFVEQNMNGFVRRRAFELYEPAVQPVGQTRCIKLRQVTNKHVSPDIVGTDSAGSFAVDIEATDPVAGTFRALALKAMQLVQSTVPDSSDTLLGLRAAVLAAGGTLERDGVRVTLNRGTRRGLHVSFQLADNTWTRVEGLGTNTQGSLSFATPERIHHLSIGRTPEQLMTDMALIWKQENAAHAAVFAAAEPAPLTNFVLDIARYQGNRRLLRTIDGIRVVIGGSYNVLHVVATDEKMLDTGNPNAAYNVVFDPDSETYQVSTSWDKQQRPFSKIPARSVTSADKLIESVATVVARHASRIVFPRRRARARKNSL
jgi:hypothetical protein